MQMGTWNQNVAPDGAAWLFSHSDRP